MNNVIHLNGQQQQGLNGVFGRWAKKVVGGVLDVVGAAAGEVPLIGGLLKSAVGHIKSELESFEEMWDWRAGSSTPAEEAILDGWLARQFNPFIQALTKEIGVAMAKKTNAEKIAGLNAILNKINTINDHFAVTGETGLSTVAVADRNEVIKGALKGINAAVATAVKSLNETTSLVTVTVPTANYNFSPLFSKAANANVTGQNYSAKGVTLPADTTIGAVTKPVKDTGVVQAAPGIIETTPSAGAGSKKNWVIIIGAIAGAALLLSNSGKSKGKKKK